MSPATLRVQLWTFYHKDLYQPAGAEGGAQSPLSLLKVSACKSPQQTCTPFKQNTAGLWWEGGGSSAPERARCTRERLRDEDAGGSSPCIPIRGSTLLLGVP